MSDSVIHIKLSSKGKKWLDEYLRKRKERLEKLKKDFLSGKLNIPKS